MKRGFRLQHSKLAACQLHTTAHGTGQKTGIPRCQCRSKRLSTGAVASVGARSGTGPGKQQGRQTMPGRCARRVWARGVVRLSRVFSEEDAADMREVVWRAWAADDGVDRRDRLTWPTGPQWKTPPAAKRAPGLPGHPRTTARRADGHLAWPSLDCAARFWQPPGNIPGFRRVAPPQAAAACGTATSATPRLCSRYRRYTFSPCSERRPSGGGGTLPAAGSHRMIGRFVRDKPGIAAQQRQGPHARSAIAATRGLMKLTGGQADRRPVRWRDL